MANIIKVRTERCKECGLCVVNCPKKAIEFEEKINQSGYRAVQVKNELCIACGVCYTMCPDGVYEI